MYITAIFKTAGSFQALIAVSNSLNTVIQFIKQRFLPLSSKISCYKKLQSIVLHRAMHCTTSFLMLSVDCQILTSKLKKTTSIPSWSKLIHFLSFDFVMWLFAAISLAFNKLLSLAFNALRVFYKIFVRYLSADISYYISPSQECEWNTWVQCCTLC